MNKKTMQAIALILSIVAVAASLGSLYLSWQTQKSATPSSVTENEPKVNKKNDENMIDRSDMAIEQSMLDIAVNEGLLPVRVLGVQRWKSEEEQTHQAAGDESRNPGWRINVFMGIQRADVAEEFYKRLGIMIGEESGYRGWNYCSLPEGWSVRNASGFRGLNQITCFNELNQAMFNVIFLIGYEKVAICLVGRE